jgi:hypothetical protein
MFALLPIVGGVLLGWLAPRRIAIAVQVVFFAIGTAVLTATAPMHSGSYRDGLLIAPALAVVSALTLMLGIWIGRRRRAASQGT